MTRPPKPLLSPPGDDPAAVPAVAILGATVRRGRQRAGLAQAELAQRAGLAQPAISLIEVGQANATVQTLQQLAGALGCPLAYLLRPG